MKNILHLGKFLLLFLLFLPYQSFADTYGRSPSGIGVQATSFVFSASHDITSGDVSTCLGSNPSADVVGLVTETDHHIFVINNTISLGVGMYTLSSSSYDAFGYTDEPWNGEVDLACWNSASTTAIGSAVDISNAGYNILTVYEDSWSGTDPIFANLFCVGGTSTCGGSSPTTSPSYLPLFIGSSEATTTCVLSATSAVCTTHGVDYAQLLMFSFVIMIAGYTIVINIFRKRT